VKTQGDYQLQPEQKLWKHLLLLSETILPGEKRWVIAKPQVVFRAKALTYTGPEHNFVLRAITVGRNWQGANIHPKNGTPMEHFRPMPGSLLPEIKSIAMAADLLSIKPGSKGIPTSEIAELLRPAIAAFKDVANNLGKIDVCHIAMDFGLLVENVGGHSRETEFKAIVYGDMLE
jgi:hypothetical protein